MIIAHRRCCWISKSFSGKNLYIHQLIPNWFDFFAQSEQKKKRHFFSETQMFVDYILLITLFIKK